MLKSKWESLKETTKKEFAENKQNLYQTGGAPAQIPSSNTIQLVVLFQLWFQWRRCSLMLYILVPNVDIQKASCSSNAWSPQQLKEPKSKELQVEKSIQTASNISVFVDKTFSVFARLQRKRQVPNGHEQLIQKKIKLMEFHGMQGMQKCMECKERRRDEG
ncbi:hypothetical protein HUJ05_012168 [Dendroctonus ponderosae]|nr:hypothetical protein HUJ05_012168 [Dendroctonus ponderosae]